MSDINDIAYDLYLDFISYLESLNDDPLTKYSISTKRAFIDYKETLYKEYYDYAKKIIRKEKLKKLNESNL
jgi:hypothetical protein